MAAQLRWTPFRDAEPISVLQSEYANGDGGGGDGGGGLGGGGLGDGGGGDGVGEDGGGADGGTIPTNRRMFS